MHKKSVIKIVIFLIVAINFLGYSIVFPILPLLMRQRGSDVFISGLIIGIYPLAQIIANPVLGHLSDIVGRRKMLLLSLVGTCISFLLIGSSTSLLVLLFARLLDGVSGGVIAIASSYIADITDEKDRTSSLGLISAATSIGFIVGPIWGATFAAINLATPFFLAAGVSFLCIILSIIFLKDSPAVAPQRKILSLASFIPLHLPKISWLLITTNLLIYAALGGFFATLSPFGTDVIKTSLFIISLIFAYTGVISAFVKTYVLQKVLKHFSEKRLLLGSPFFGIIGMLLIAFPIPLLLFIIGITIFSIADSLLGPILLGIASKQASQTTQGSIMGVMQSSQLLGRALGTAGISFLYAKISPFSTGVSGAVLYMLVFCFTLLLVKQPSLKKN